MRGLDKALASRSAEFDEGIAFARTWRAKRYPIAASAPYPFHHRNCLQWAEASE